MSSSSTSTPTHWDVFLSFRGEDTRTGFTSYLYDALIRNGIRTFMDDPDLRCGEIISAALLTAIRNSKTYIIVLSQNYASSSWCLDELVEILRCFKEFRRWVIPIFYKIDPSVVRHQLGSFRTAFEKHENVYFGGEMEKVNNWRHTLNQVANISGKHVVQTRPEVDHINEVVDAVLRAINPMTLNIAKYPVGIDSSVAEITPLLTAGSQGVHYIGIWGMGGVGKTTLAKAVFNANFGSFEGSSFLANVREVFAQPNGQQRLQAQLIADVLKVQKSEIDSVDEGIELIRRRITSKKVLIVVDDLNDPKQLNYLVVAPFASGSVIILTTRHEDLLVTVGVEATYRYMLNELGDAQSRELFNKYAFRDEKPSHTFVVLSEEILHHARGLPLAIEIFGSTLCKQSEEEWRRFIGQLKKVVNPKIQEKLVISFESLADSTLKEMFLDIACFFVGNRREDVLPVLGSCYEDVDANIDHLKSRCLIKIDENNQFSMHDLVQDMGWEIARQSSDKDELEKHSRVSGWEDIYNVLDDNMGSKEIKGMVHHYDYSESDKVTFDIKVFKRMPNLRFLKMKDINLTGSLGKIFKNLTWLHWYHCPLMSLSSDFYPKKLVILELRGSKITSWKLTKDLRNLKILDLSNSEELITIPDFCRLPCLEKIKLHNCGKLMEVDTTIGELKNLVSLDLSSCASLRRLPDSVCKLTALKSLNVGKCHSLEALPEELGNIVSLTSLAVGSPNILELPDSLARLSKLVDLNLDGNKKLETVGDTIGNMRSLEVLYIYDCENLEKLLPYGIAQLSNVQLPPNMKSLTLFNCRSMTRLPNLSNLKHLKILKLLNCRGLIVIEGLEELQCIAELNLEGSFSILRLSDLSKWRHLKALYLGYCSSLTEIKGLATSIRYLKLNDCASLRKLPNLSNLKQLQQLDLRNCSSLTEIEGLKGLASILQIELVGCDSTMVSKTFTSSLFQIYSKFGNKIEIDISKGDNPKWMCHSGREFTEVLTNVSSNFLGLLLSFACYGELDERCIFHCYTYTINNETKDMYTEDAVMLLVPRKDLIKSYWGYDGATIFQVKAWCASHKDLDVKVGVHPLYRVPQISHASTLAKRKKE